MVQSRLGKNDFLLGFARTRRDEPEAVHPIDPDRADHAFGMVMVDAAADISGSMAAHPRLRVLPLAVQWDGRSFLVRGEPDRRREGPELGRAELRGAEIAAPGVDALAYRLYPNIALNTDHLIIVASMPAFGDPAAALRAMLDLHRDETRELRRGRGLAPELAVSVVDGGSILAGPALQARVLLKRLARGDDPAAVAAGAAALRAATRLWLVPRLPRDLTVALAALGDPTLAPWIRACSTLLRPYPVLGADGGEACVRGSALRWSSAMADALEQVAAALTPGAEVQVSYDGSLRELQAQPALERLRERAMATRSRLHLTHMSLAGRIRATPGSLSIALLTPPGTAD